LIASITEDVQAVSQITYSPDGRRAAYIVKRDGKELVVLNDKAGPEYAYVNELQFSRDGSRFGYIAGEGKKESSRYVAVIDGVQGLWSEVHPRLAFSRDGHHAAYDAKQNGKMFVVVDDQIGPRFDYIFDLNFAADSEIYYFAKNGGGVLDYDGWVLVLGKDQLPLGKGFPSEPTISENYEHIAYTLSRDEGTHLVIDNQVGKTYYQIKSPVFSSDGKSLAFVANFKEDADFLVIATIETSTDHSEKPIVHETTRSPEYDAITDVILNSDGSKFAYRAIKNGKRIVVTSDRQIPDFDEVFSLLFSADGKKLAFVAGLNGKELVVLADQRGPAFDEIRDPVFSADGQALWYGARDGKQLWWKVMKPRS